MFPLAMAVVLAAFCALITLLLPAPDHAGYRRCATGSELAQVCEAAAAALSARAEARESGESVPALSREEILSWLAPGFRAPDNWQLARQGSQVFVWLAEPGVFPADMRLHHGVCSNGKLGSLALPAAIPHNALVCLAGEDEVSQESSQGTAQGAAATAQ